MTVEEARRELERLRGEGTRCPCCDQFVKVYRRKINSTMARALILLYREGGWVHVSSKLDSGSELSKTRFWFLVEEREDAHSGWWRLTSLGREFVLGQTDLPKYAEIYNNQLLCLDFSESITIRDALGTRFNYRDLMEGR